MKKVSFLMIAAFVAMSSVFVSCSDDEDSALDISFANGKNTVTLDKGVTSYEVYATITSSAGLDEVKIFSVTSAGRDQIGDAITSNFTPNKNEFIFKQTFNVYEDTEIEIRAKDKNNREIDRNFTIKVTKETPAANAVVNIWPGRVLGAQSNSADGSSCASVDGTVYTISAAKTNIKKVDFIYFYQTTGDKRLAELVSPAAANLTWLESVKSNCNATKFTNALDITATQFDNIKEATGAELIDELVTDKTATLNYAANLSAGKYVGFITANGQKGIIKVVNVSGTEAGTITIDIKVQKAN